MIDPQASDGSDWKQTLDLAVSAAGHEARNALNGLVVNLEVVRAMAQRAGHDAEPFMGQAVAQSELSVRLTEATFAMLKLVVAALGPDGRLTFESREHRQISLECGADAEILSAALGPLADRGVIAVERSGSTVILRIPVERHENPRE